MRVLITAGPTREYIDDVRYITNGSSGQMGYLLAQAAADRGWEVVLVTGPVVVPVPSAVRALHVVSAQEMLKVCRGEWEHCDGLIAVAAVSDYRPSRRFPGKHHSGEDNWHLELEPNPDILAEFCRVREHRWAVGFAVESEDIVARARAKRERKQCDAIVVNPTASMEASETHIQIINSRSDVVLSFEGSKKDAAQLITKWIAENLANPSDDQAVNSPT